MFSSGVSVDKFGLDSCLVAGIGLDTGLDFPCFLRIDAGDERLDDRLSGGVAGKFAVVGVTAVVMEETELVRLEAMCGECERSDVRDGLRR